MSVPFVSFSRPRPFIRFSLSICALWIGALAVQAAEPVPPNGDPANWACPGTVDVDLEDRIQSFCSNRSKRSAAPDWVPQSLLRLQRKNDYDQRFGQWLTEFSYRDWVKDKTWRFTGPIVGALSNDGIADGARSYGVHPAVRIYYSPKVVDWLCGGRKGEVEDGAVIVKEMLPITEPKVEVDDNACMSIPDQNIDDDKIFWAVMVKDSDASHDGWYWYANASGGNPPIVDRSAFTKAASVPSDPQQPDPEWYPTNTASEYTPPGGKQELKTEPLTVTPYNLFGAYCLNCHASAASESTYASLDNRVSEGIQYKFYRESEAKGDTGAATRATAAALHDRTPARKGEETKAAPADTAPTRPPPFSTPLAAPTDHFTTFYDQIQPVDFAAAWSLRLPAETFDHRVASEEGPGQYLTSDQCIGCHDASYSNSETPNMVFEDAEGNQVNLSPYSTWRTSPMGLAGRDPIFFSQLQSETNNLPELTACIENTCLHCHGVMGQRQLARDTRDYDGDTCKDIFPVEPPMGVPFGKPFRLSDVTEYQNTDDAPHGGEYGGLARDGISCTVCHHISDVGLGEESGFTGNFIADAADKVFGPYEDDTIVPKPMEHALGITPEFGKQIRSSQMCSSCHNILLPVFTNDGKPLEASYEQTTGLEWVNSDFAKPGDSFQSCQDCHMRTTYEGKPLRSEIANIEASNNFPPTTERLPDEEIHLTERDRFPRHTLLGLNVFLNEMFQQFPALLGLKQIDYMNSSTTPALVHTRNQFIDIAENETADLALGKLSVDGDTVTGEVTVTNKVGHYLPSGVGFRRVILEYRLLDEQGNTLWCSGCTNDLGVVVDGATLSQSEPTPLPSELPIANPKAYQPHYQTIDAEGQAQIYQELIEDSEGNFTTSFLRRAKHVKDNRLRPKGYDPKFYERQFDSKYIEELATTYGEAASDAYYTDPSLTGADKIVFKATLDDGKAAEVAAAQVRLYNQSIPPFYLQQRFRDANRGPAEKDEIRRLWYLTSHLNVDTEVNGGQPIRQWKLGLACAKTDAQGRVMSCEP